jgi:phenylalanyl-tRNA synthetase beta chain
MLVDLDYQEVITYSFVDPAWETALDAALRPLPLANPLASQLSAMRTTLWGGLLETLRHNLNRQQARVRIFELGRVYRSQTEQPMKLGGLAYGDALPEQWGAAARRVDFFDSRATSNGSSGMRWIPGGARIPRCTRGSAPKLGGRPAIGWIGALHPRMVQAFDLPAAPVLFEIDSDAVAQASFAASCDACRDSRRCGAIWLSCWTPIPGRRGAGRLREAAQTAMRAIDVFDEYRGKGVAENQKSLAIRVVMQDTERTLTDQEVEDAVQKLVDAALRQCNDAVCVHDAIFYQPSLPIKT